MDPGAHGRLALLLRMLDAGRLLAPACRRDAWRDQWRGDLWHGWDAGGSPPPLGWQLRLFLRCLAAWQHALWLRFHQRTIEMITHDLRYGWRLMLRQRSFTAIAVLTMALGIGANVTIYSWIDALLLHPMPGVAASGRILVLNATTATRDNLSLSWPNFVDLRASRPASVDDLFAFSFVALDVRVGDQPQRAWGLIVSANYFDVLGVRPPLGRGFAPDEDRVPDGAAVVVVSDAFWRNRLGGDPAAVGKPMIVNGRTFTIVGVAPPGFRGNASALSADLWVPMMMQKTVIAGDRLGQRGNGWLQAMVRLRPGITVKRAQADFDVAAKNLAAANRANEGRGLRLYPLWRAPGTAAGLMLPVLSVLLGVVGIVLLIACANVANLLLVRGAGRQRETAVRVALGASRSRVVQQLLTENMLLAIAGGAGGVVIAYWTAGLLRLFMPPSRLPIVGDASVTWPVLAFAVLVTSATAFVFGLVPALQGSAADVVPALKEAATPLATGRGRALVRQWLVVAQVALSMMLLVSAGLFVRTLVNAQAADVGFSLRQGLLASIDLLPAGYNEARGTAVYRDLLARVRSVPGVEAATLTQRVPLDLGGGSDTTVEVDGYVRQPNEEMTTYWSRVGSRYLGTLGIGVVAGRDFDERDIAGAPDVAIINETMAKRYWAGRDPVGGRVRMGVRVLQVVGVARDGKYSSVTEPPRAFMYVPLQQWYRPDTVLVVKTSLDPTSTLAAVQRELRQIDPNLPMFDVQTLEEHLMLSLFVQRMAATLLAAFGLLAVLLATVGLYGVIAASVSQRTREIGLRKALGATNRDIAALVLGQGLRVTALGLLLGAAGALGATRLFRSQLIGVSGTDPLSYAAVTALLLAVALVAVYVPSRRAAAFDPARSLRYE